MRARIALILLALGGVAAGAGVAWFGYRDTASTELVDAQAQADFAALDLDVAIVVAYGLILPQPVLDAPRRGCINIHASLLPRWRGAAPIQRAIEAGDSETGVTIMQMDAGLDTGPMLLSDAVPITGETTGASTGSESETSGTTRILVTHDEQVASRAGRIIRMLDGRVAN